MIGKLFCAVGIGAIVALAGAVPGLAAGGAAGSDLSDMLARARAEAPDRNVAPVEHTAPTPVADPAEAAARKRELDHISALIRQAKEKQAARVARTPAVMSGRATVLLVVEPGTWGIRRFARTADPVLCTDASCYVSAGADQSARALPRQAALGMGNTLGRRAEACNHKTGCVFRNVEIGAGTRLQPVDLHILRHDVREASEVRLDDTCRVARGLLVCSGSVHTASYTMWIVPESVVAKLGPGVLDRAVARGLAPVLTADTR